ncbi:hypothetical protein C0991_009697 [Blastosporella zonata]|nr:hypothetical protein C0991_009697 [Blastosporella zonata]
MVLDNLSGPFTTTAVVKDILEDFEVGLPQSIYIPMIGDFDSNGNDPPKNTLDLASILKEFLSDNELLGQEEEEWLDNNADAEVPSADDMGSTHKAQSKSTQQRKRPQMEDSNLNSNHKKEWYPWPNKLEFSNPYVWPHLCFYAEDNGSSVNEYYQAKHWREASLEPKADPQIKLTPMASIGGQYFFLYEPCILQNSQVCMPYEWFCQGNKLYAMAWPLQPSAAANGWIVEEFQSFEVPEEFFLVSFPS